MILDLDVEGLQSLDQVRALLDGNEPVDFNSRSREEAYAFVQRMLARFDYRLGVGKADHLSGVCGVGRNVELRAASRAPYDGRSSLCL